MSGLTLQTGLSGSVVDGLYGGTGAAQPTRTALPEGPTTVAAAAYGYLGSGGSGVGGNAGTHSVLIGAIAAGLLFFMWWTLPR